MGPRNKRKINRCNCQSFYHAQPKVRFEVVKITVVVEQLKIFFDAEGGDKRVNYVADRDA